MFKKISRGFLAIGFLALAACGGDDSSSADDNTGPIPPRQLAQAIAQLDERAQTLMAATGIPGMAIAVVHDGKTVYAKGFGVRKVGEATAIDADTVFQLASLSKPVGATVVAHQVGKGGISWDTPVVQYLPWFALSNSDVTRQLTVGDLYAHRSGLPEHAGDDLEDLGYDRHQVLERLRLLPLQEFRKHYDYTNFGLTAGAEAVAVAARTDWAALSDAVLYRPLGMASTSSRFSDYIARGNRAVPHVREAGTWLPKYQRQPDAQSPAGGVSSSASDMARWLALVLQDGRYEGRQVVASAALQPATTAQILSSPPHEPGAPAGYYGYGFNVGTHASGRATLSHSGAFTLGAATNFVAVPSAKVGIIILTNAQPIGAAEALGMEFTDLVLLGEITRDWRTAYAQAFADMMAPEGALAGQAPPANPSPALPPQAYVGSYFNDYLGEVQVSQDNGVLTLTLGPAAIRYPLEHWDGNRYIFRTISEVANPGSVFQASFTPGPSGLASTLEIEMYKHGTGTLNRR